MSLVGAEGTEGTDFNGWIGSGGTGRDQDINEVFFYPSFHVVANAVTALDGPGDAGCKVEGSAALLGQFVSHLPRRPHEVGEDVAQAIGIVGGEVEGVALPVEFDAVPGVVLAEFAQVLEAIFAHLGDGHIPRQGKPLLGILAEEPFGVIPAQLGQLDVVQGL